MKNAENMGYIQGKLLILSGLSIIKIIVKADQCNKKKKITYLFIIWGKLTRTKITKPNTKKSARLKILLCQYRKYIIIINNKKHKNRK